jgi:hypothetical protein
MHGKIIGKNVHRLAKIAAKTSNRKKRELYIMVHMCNSSTQEAEIGGS